MKIRELIDALEKIAKEHGDDLEVCLDDDGIFRAPSPTYYGGNHSDGTVTDDGVLL